LLAGIFLDPGHQPFANAAALEVRLDKEILDLVPLQADGTDNPALLNSDDSFSLQSQLGDHLGGIRVGHGLHNPGRVIADVDGQQVFADQPGNRVGIFFLKGSDLHAAKICTFLPGLALNYSMIKTGLGKAFLAALFLLQVLNAAEDDFQWSHGAIIRGPTDRKQIALVFTGGDYADGGQFIRRVLRRQAVPATFFFTGDFYRNPQFRPVIRKLRRDGHFLGAHSDKHLLYCSWQKRDSLLVTKAEFAADLQANYAEMQNFGVRFDEARFFMPPYEWYNDSIAAWTAELGIRLINFTPGTLSSADYTIPSMKNYRPSDEIFRSIVSCEEENPHGLNGFILLMHIGTHPERKDKFYRRLEELIGFLRQRGYTFVRIDKLLGDK